MPDLKKIEINDLVGKDEYDDTFDVEVFTEDRICFQITKDNQEYVYEAHVSDENVVDYTIYDGLTLKHLDGGQIECSDCSLTLDVLIAIAEQNRFDSVAKEEVSLLDYDNFIDEIY